MVKIETVSDCTIGSGQYRFGFVDTKYAYSDWTSGPVEYVGTHCELGPLGPFAVPARAAICWTLVITAILVVAALISHWSRKRHRA